MTQALLVHANNPQVRLLRIAVAALCAGKIIVYPTDSNYALGCRIGDKQALERICLLKGLKKDHKFTLLCQDLSVVSRYAKLSDIAFGIIKTYAPGPYTFILPASHELPKRLQAQKRKTIGMSIPACAITRCLLQEYGEPLLSTSCIFEQDAGPLHHLDDIYRRCKGQVDCIIYGESSVGMPTTVVDLTTDYPVILRQGRGMIDVVAC